MNKNYAYIIITVIIACFLFSSCKKKHFDITLIKTLNNTTDKELYYEVETGEGTKAIHIEQVNMDSVVFYKEGYITIYFLAMDIFIYPIKVHKEMLYNLTDTTMFEYITRSYEERSEAEKMFINNTTYNEYGDVYSKVYKEKVEITDTFLQLLPKDYSMLEKFPEYYGN